MSFVRALPLSQDQSASENGAIFLSPAAWPFRAVDASVAAGGDAGGGAAATAEVVVSVEDEDSVMPLASAFVPGVSEGADAAAVAVSRVRDFFSSASSSSMRLRIASSSS